MSYTKALKSTVIMLFLVVMMAVPAHAEERIDLGDNLAVGLRAELGQTLYLLQIGGRDQGFGSNSNITYLDGTLGATLFYDRWGFDVYGRMPVVVMKEKDEFGTKTKDFDRFELGTAVNYQITEQWGAFAGYRYGSTDVTWDFVSDTTVNFDVNGPTAGMSYGWVKDKHVFTILGGIGYQMGDLDMETPVGSFDDSATALGFVGNVAYRYLIDDNWDFKVGLDGYYFDFGKVNINNEDYTLTEETYSLRMGLSYTF